MIVLLWGRIEAGNNGIENGIACSRRQQKLLKNKLVYNENDKSKSFLSNA